MQVSKEAMIALLMLAPCPPLLAQVYDPYAPAWQWNTDPRVRRALRERAVAYAGEFSREFVETQGDPAVAAIFACSQPGAQKLVEFYNSGELGKLPRPADLLRVISQPGNGDDVVLYAMQHATELTDVDNFDAYLFSPLDYAYALRKLSEGAAEARARRLTAKAAATRWQVTLDGQKLAIIGGVLGIALLLWWRRRRQMA